MTTKKKPRLLITNILVFVVTGLISLVFVPIEVIFRGLDWAEVITCISLIWITGMAITAGYHRLWAHKSYQANPIVRVMLAIAGAMALQNSILHWSSDHRIHHRHVDDNDKDPYSAKKGFWYSHIGWMLREYQAQRYSDYKNCKDLQKDKVVMWQHNNYLAIMLIANFAIPMFLGWLNGDVWGMLLVAGVFRLVIVHHITFFINSLAHIWGKQPYTDLNTARDNGILAFFTFGEGYHNYHHIFEYDYRNGIKWWQFDPTKWLIKSLSFVGLTSQLRKCPEQRIEQAKAAMQLKRAQAKLELMPNSQEVLVKLQTEYDLLVAKMAEFYSTKRRMMDAKKENLLRSYESLELHFKYKEIKNALSIQKRKWSMINEMYLQPA